MSKLLQIPLYDRSLVEMAAEKMGLSPITVEEVDEAALHSFLSTYRIPKTPNDVTGYGLPLNDSTYLTPVSYTHLFLPHPAGLTPGHAWEPLATGEKDRLGGGSIFYSLRSA